MLSPIHSPIHSSGASSSTPKIDISLNDLYPRLRKAPVDITHPVRGWLIEDVFELQHPKTRDEGIIQQEKIYLLSRNTRNPDDEQLGNNFVLKQAGNNRLLLESLHRGYVPLFDALLKTTKNPDLPPLIERAILARNDSAFQKLFLKLSKMEKRLPQSTLQWAAECGQPGKLQTLLQHTPGIGWMEKNKLQTLALRQKGAIKADSERPLNEREEALSSLVQSQPSEGWGQKLGRLIMFQPSESSAYRRQRLLVLLQTPGINVNKTYGNNRTLLQSAAESGNQSLLKALLLVPGIRVNQANQTGMTALHYAAEKGDTECVRALVSAPDINVNQHTIEKITPLHLAATNGHIDTLKLLLSVPGIKINQQSGPIKQTPLHLAAANGYTDCVKALLSMPDIAVNCPNDIGFMPLHLAARNGHVDSVRELASTPGILLNQQAGRFLDTPLHLAVEQGHLSCVQALVQASGIDVNQPKGFKMTPLHIATQRGDLNIIQALLQAPGIDVNARNETNQTPLRWARTQWNNENQYPTVVQLLHQHGGIG